MGRFYQLLEDFGLNEEKPIAGIAGNEICELAAAQGQTELPAIYLEFLKDCGKSAGLFQRDAVFFFPGIKNLKIQLLEMLEEEAVDFSIPENIFVFGSYQGFQFDYFICDGNDDPAIYRIDDGGDEPVLMAENFSKYIEKGIIQYHRTFYNGENKI